MRDVILTDRGPNPSGPYSQAIRANGFLYLSGQVALDFCTFRGRWRWIRKRAR